MAFAGRKALIKVSGSAVAFTDEATTSTDDQNYQITNVAKRVLDRSAAITVEEDGVPTAESYTINRLTGTITFETADPLRGVITVSGSYLPLSTAAEAREYSWSLSAANEDVTPFNSTYISRAQTLKDVAASLTKWYSIDNLFYTALQNGDIVLLEFYTDASQTFDMKCWARVSSDEISGAVDGLIEESIEFEGSVDDDGNQIAFGG